MKLRVDIKENEKEIIKYVGIGLGSILISTMISDFKFKHKMSKWNGCMAYFKR